MRIIISTPRVTSHCVCMNMYKSTLEPTTNLILPNAQPLSFGTHSLITFNSLVLTFPVFSISLRSLAQTHWCGAFYTAERGHIGFSFRWFCWRRGQLIDGHCLWRTISESTRYLVNTLCRWGLCSTVTLTGVLLRDETCLRRTRLETSRPFCTTNTSKRHSAKAGFAPLTLVWRRKSWRKTWFFPQSFLTSLASHAPFCCVSTKLWGCPSSWIQ